MMEFFDIHTHTWPGDPSQGVVNIRYPESFVPVPRAWYSVGVHPWDVVTAGTVDWEAFCDYVTHPQVVAIGECGLDRSVQAEQWDRQKLLFCRQAAWSDALKKPLFIHNVQATETLLELRKWGNFKGPWMLHGFRGRPETAEQVLKKGFYLSFGSRFNEESLRIVPLDRLLLETDDSGADISSIYEQAATVRGIPVDELAAHVRQNVRTLLGI